jgi:hypothetical protein
MPGHPGFVSEHVIVFTIASTSIQDSRGSTKAEYSHPGRRHEASGDHSKADAEDIGRPTQTFSPNDLPGASP